MKRFLLLFLLFGFLLWILPLGYFIKPSQEHLVCDGQRAFCMCCMMKPKVADKAMEAGVSLKAGTSTGKESSSGGGNYFVSTKPIVMINLHLASVIENPFLAYKNPFLASVDYVPKI